MKVYISERGDRWIRQDGRRRRPLALGLGGIAEAQFDPGGEFDVDPAFAVVAAGDVGSQGLWRGTQDSRLLQGGTGELAALRRLTQGQLWQRRILRRREPGHNR